MAFSTTLDAIAVCLQANYPFHAIGRPGVGKSTVVGKIARQLGWERGKNMEIIIPSFRDPTEICGVTVMGSDGMPMLAAPSWARRLAEYETGFVFLDELTTAIPALQAPLMGILKDGLVGELWLPAGIRRGAASNPPDQAAAGYDLAAPVENRMVHIPWERSYKDFINGAMGGWRDDFDVPKLDPKAYARQIPQSRALALSFLNFRPTAYAAEKMDGNAWASERTWEMSWHLHAAAHCMFRGPRREECAGILLSGAIGQGVALEFLGWTKNLDLPDPEKVLADPESFTPPERSDRAFAAVSAVLSFALTKLKDEKDKEKGKKIWKNAWHVAHRCHQCGHKDVAAILVRPLAEMGQTAQYDPLQVKQYLLPFAPLLRALGVLYDERAAA